MAEALQLAKVGGKNATVAATFTRPANATPYTANQVVSDGSPTHLLDFEDLASDNGGSGTIVKAILWTDLKTEVAAYDLYLYTQNEGTVSVPVDGANDTTMYANRALEVGKLSFTAAGEGQDGTTSTGARQQWTGTPIAFVCDAADTSLYGKLVNVTGTTPASGQKFWVQLTVIQN